MNHIPDTITDMKIIPLQDSKYLKPMRAVFKINGKQKYWDFLTVHDSVAILIFNVTREVFVLVRQFRPAIYLGKIPNIHPGTAIDMKKYTLETGYSIELCAGLVDKEGEVDDIAREEILEECGYDIPVTSLRKLFSFREVGIVGNTQHLFYAEVTDNQKVSEGGGLREEGEYIEVVELTIPEIKKYLDSKDLLSPPPFLAAIQWFFQNVSKA